MQIKILSKVISDIFGKSAEELVNMLIGKKNVNEFKIAKKLKLSINNTRNILYKLSNIGLISFVRKKDKKKGWYTYFWTLNLRKSFDLLEEQIKKEIRSISGQIESRKTKRFYICKTCDYELSEENALLHNFTCEECGQVFELNEDTKILRGLELKKKKLLKELEIVREAKSEEEKKREKKIKRAEKKEQKKAKKKVKKKSSKPTTKKKKARKKSTAKKKKKRGK